MNEAILCYVPVFHEGYRRFFDENTTYTILILGEDVVERFRQLVKDVRRLPSQVVAQLLSSLYPERQVEVLNWEEALRLNGRFDQLILPDELELNQLLDEVGYPASLRTHSRTFLRWDKERVLLARPVTRAIQLDQFVASRMLGLASEHAALSGDWWRQVGAVLARNGEVLATGYNQHAPSHMQPYYDGDPRASFKKGLHIELSTATHAEVSVIGHAARRGIALEGADLYVTTFPCPPCARLIAASGIARIFYAEGYAMLDGEEFLASAGIEVIHVDKTNEAPG